MKPFGDYIRKIRVNKGLTLREAAEKIGIKPPYLSRIETNLDKPPSIEKLRKMAEVYGLDEMEVIDHAHSRAAEVYGEEVMENPALHVLFKAVRNLNDEELIELIKKVCPEEKDLNSLLAEIKRRKKNDIGPTLSRLSKEQAFLFHADVKPRYLSKIRISQMAYKVLERYFKSLDAYKPPTPIEQIAEWHKDIRMRMDLKLDKFASGRPYQLGMSNWSPEGHREIHINSSLATKNKTDIRMLRYTVAHELFHCLEHLPLMNKKSRRDNAFARLLLEVENKKVQTVQIEHEPKMNDYVKKWISATNKPRKLETRDDWREWQSDFFASCILMPDWSVKHEFEKRMGIKNLIVEESSLRRTADLIARETIFSDGIFEKTLFQLYNVSVRAMAIRLLELKLVSC